MRYQNVTWRIILYMITYLPLNYDTSVVLRNILEVTRTYLMDVGFRKASCISGYYPLSVFLAWTTLLPVVSRFIQEAPLTQRDRKHTVSRNRVKCCINVWQIASDVCDNRKTTRWWVLLLVLPKHSRSCEIFLPNRWDRYHFTMYWTPVAVKSFYLYSLIHGSITCHLLFKLSGVSLSYHLVTVMCVWMLTRVAQIITAAHREVWSCVNRPTSEPWLHTKNEAV